MLCANPWLNFPAIGPAHHPLSRYSKPIHAKGMDEGARNV